jgi:uncharacterized phage-associated protein
LRGKIGKNIKMNYMKGSNKKRVSALDVSQYLLSLDPGRKYFTSKRMSSEEGWGDNPPIEGNFRLNKLLHIFQILHYVKYGEFLFSEDMIAYRNGAVVEMVSKSFLNELYLLENYPRIENLDSRRKDFLRAKIEHFEEYSNYELQDLSHEDPSWWLARERGNNIIMSRSPNVLGY